MNNLFNFENKIKDKIKNGGVSIGAFLLSGSSFIAEAMANQELDWILIDMEASHATKEDVLHILQALNGYEVCPLIRISDQNKHLIDFSLDFGAKGVMIPKIDTAKQAKEMVDACFYAPKGSRGVNPIRASGFYTKALQNFKQANSCVTTIVQIESKESINNIDEIAQIEAIDILFVGLGDLAASYGQVGSIGGKQMQDALKKVIEVCEKYNKIAGIFAHSNDVAKQYIKDGFKFVGVGNDIKFLNQGLADCLQMISK